MILKECKELIYKLHKSRKIGVVNIDGINYEKATLEQIQAGEVKISKKYLDLFVESGLVYAIHTNFVESPRTHLIITDKGKIKDFNISIHAMRQFLRRYYICNNDEKMKIHLSSVIKNGFDLMKNDITDIIFKNDYMNPDAIDLFISFLKNATTNQTISSARDQRELKRRSNRYENSTYMFSHPFMFVVVDGTIATVELSSQSFDCRNSNKIASTELRWNEYFSKNGF